MENKRLRLVYPQWHGGMNPNYVFGSKLLAHIVPPSIADEETVEIEVDKDFEGPAAVFNGVDCGEALLKEMIETKRILDDKKPEQIIVFGGDCSVSQIPFDYLSGKYGDKLGILWLDAHPDVSSPKDSAHLHEMVLADLMGQNPESELTKVHCPVQAERVLLAGLIEERLRPMDMVCKALNIRIASPEQLQKNSEPVLQWIQESGIQYLAVHWDLDVLSPADYRSIYPAEPYTDTDDFPAAVGRLTLAEVGRILNDVSERAEIVGLCIAEHLPWDAINLRKALSEISIFKY